VPASIAVLGGNTEAVFASTCSLGLKLPYGFASYSEFESSMRAIFKGKQYTLLSPWANWLKMADRYHLRWQRLSYIKLKVIMSTTQKYMIASLYW